MTLAAHALIAGLLAALLTSAAPTYDPPLSEQCDAMHGENPRELAAWLADRNGIPLAEARLVVTAATVTSCAP